MGVWNKTVEEQLINMIQERPALYTSEARYASRGLKPELWRELEDKLVISEKELKRKWESLRTQYTRYKRLLVCTSRQQWILARLQFLEPHTSTKKTPSRCAVWEPSSSAASCSDSPSDTGTGSETRPGTPPDGPTITVEVPCFFEDEPSPRATANAAATPLVEAGVRRVESDCSATPPVSPLGGEPRPNTSSQPSAMPRPPPAKRRKRKKKTTPTPHLSAGVDTESAHMLRVICKTLESLAPREGHRHHYRDDGIAAYCKNIEHRMRKLPPRLLPHFQHEVDTILFKYSVDPSPGVPNV